MSETPTVRLDVGDRLLAVRLGLDVLVHIRLDRPHAPVYLPVRWDRWRLPIVEPVVEEAVDSVPHIEVEDVDFVLGPVLLELVVEVSVIDRHHERVYLLRFLPSEWIRRRWGKRSSVSRGSTG